MVPPIPRLVPINWAPVPTCAAWASGMPQTPRFVLLLWTRAGMDARNEGSPVHGRSDPSSAFTSQLQEVIAIDGACHYGPSALFPEPGRTISWRMN